MKQKDVVRTLVEHREELIEQYGVQSLALFGSVVRNEAGDASDVDMLVEFSRPTGYFGLVALQAYLAQKLHKSVDLGTLRSLKARVRALVEAEMQYVF